MTIVYDLFALLLQIEIPKPEGFWPVTIVGWVTVIGFIATSAWLLIQAGRWTAQLESHKKEVTTDMNAFGGRLSRLELGKEHEEGRVDALEVQQSRTQGQYEALIALIGEAKGSVEQFRVGMMASGEKVERKIDEMKIAQNQSTLELSQRLTAVETSLQHLENRT
jgi:SMC interacting uncharacterized protein involved in chromosome segregation